MSKTVKIIGNHPEIRNVRRRIRRVAPTSLNVIIYGEAGTECPAVAELIHRKSLRSEGPFVHVDCHRLLDQICETGDDLLRQSYFTAEGGTLFFENIDILGAENQRILYALAFVPKKHPSYPEPKGVRIITASTTPALIEQTGFNRHLFLLLSQYSISIIPVRRRRGDIPLLFDYYFSRAVEKRGYKDKPAVSDEIVQSFMMHDWNGNLKELEKVVDTLLDLSPSDRLTPEALPFSLPDNSLKHLEEMGYHAALAYVDEFLIRRALERSGWNQSKAARSLNMTEGNIRLKIRKYGIVKGK